MVSDLLGTGKIVKEILELLSKAVGTVYNDYTFSKKEKMTVDLEAYRIEKLAEANAKADLIKQDIKSNGLKLKYKNSDELEERARNRFITTILREEANIEKIIRETIQTCYEDEQKNHAFRKINDDWINQFIDYAKNISSGDIQKIWARILAMQATEGKPTISKATLDSLRLIETSQATMFNKVVRLYISMGKIMDVNHTNPDIDFSQNDTNVSMLEDLGLLRLSRLEESTIDLAFGTLSFWSSNLFVYKNKLDELKMIITDNNSEKPMNVVKEKILIEHYNLTARGYELACVNFENFYELLYKPLDVEISDVCEYGKSKNRKKILCDWALKFSRMDVMVVFNEKKQQKENKNMTLEYEPVSLFDSLKKKWINFPK